MVMILITPKVVVGPYEVMRCHMTFTFFFMCLWLETNNEVQ